MQIIKDKEKIFVYKLMADNGGAPCVYDNKLSLCICKPKIRISAEKNDWIVGFGGRSKPELADRLIYIAQVSEKMVNGDYYKSELYKNRPDCIYKWDRTDSQFAIKINPKFHGSKEELDHDLGISPGYDRAYSLLCDKYVYLGDKSSDEYPKLFENIRNFYQSLPRNYIMNISEQNKKDLVNFIEAIVDKFGYGAHGKPTHWKPEDQKRKCNTSEDAVIEVSATKGKSCQ